MRGILGLTVLLTLGIGYSIFLVAELFIERKKEKEREKQNKKMRIIDFDNWEDKDEIERQRILRKSTHSLEFENLIDWLLAEKIQFRFRLYRKWTAREDCPSEAVMLEIETEDKLFWVRDLIYYSLSDLKDNSLAIFTDVKVLDRNNDLALPIRQKLSSKDVIEYIKEKMNGR